jgi:hypothetical protein
VGWSEDFVSPSFPPKRSKFQSGPEPSRARRFSARRERPFDGEDRCETIVAEGKATRFTAMKTALGMEQRVGILEASLFTPAFYPQIVLQTPIILRR